MPDDAYAPSERIQKCMKHRETIEEVIKHQNQLAHGHSVLGSFFANSALFAAVQEAIRKGY